MHPIRLTPHYATAPTPVNPLNQIDAPSSSMAPPTPAPAPPTATPKPEVDYSRENRDALAIITGNEGSGSAFICKVGNGTVLFTNSHVVADITAATMTRVDGVPLTAGAADVAAGRDIARIALSQPSAHPLEVIKDFDKNVQIGDEVVVLGNSAGGGVVTKLSGKLVGIGPDRIEVSAEFIPGNSGSPIIHVKTGQVIGIATYLTKRYEHFSSSPTTAPGAVVIRRFGYRLDNALTWEPLEWNEFHAEGVIMGKISTLTADIFDFFANLRSGNQPNFATDTLRRPAQEWFGVLQNNHLSDVDRKDATRRFMSTLRSMVRSDINAAAARLRYTYFREELQKESHIRDELYKGFDKASSKLSEPSMQPKAVRKSS